MLEALKKRKIFNVIKGIIVGKPIDEIYYNEYKEILIKVTNEYNLPIIYNLNFGHALPHLILPYGEKMVIDFNKKEIACFADIDAESVFYESDYEGIYSYTGFEFIAQACGVYYGLEARLVYKRPPKFGFVLRVNNLECTEMIIPAGKSVVVYAKEKLRDGAFAYFDGEVYVDDRLITKATLMLMESMSGLGEPI